MPDELLEVARTHPRRERSIHRGEILSRSELRPRPAEGSMIGVDRRLGNPVEGPRLTGSDRVLEGRRCRSLRCRSVVVPTKHAPRPDPVDDPLLSRGGGPGFSVVVAAVQLVDVALGLLAGDEVLHLAVDPDP